METRPDEKTDRSFYGQPRSLSTLFGVELWERFSFYGMQGLLLLYLIYSVTDGGLDIARPVAAGIVGAYGGGVYLATVLGAWVSDRLLGPSRTLLTSAVIVMLGHLALALIPGVAGVIAGLLLVGAGSGGLKATSTALVGSLYSEHDTRRDAGFSLYYLGINLGAFFGPLLTGALQDALGFHIGFALAAVGMAAGLIQYIRGRRHLPDSALVVPNPLPAGRRPLVVAIALGVVLVVLAAVALGVITADNLALIVIIVTALAAVAYFVVILSSRRLSSDERSRVVAFIPLFLASAVFWSIYQQQFTVITLYTDERLDRSLFGWMFPVPWVQSINPIFVILLSGAFAALWTRLGARQPSTPVKFAGAAIVVGLAFLLFLPFSGTGAHGTPVLAIVLILFVFTVAELLLAPVGLSVATKLAPAAFSTQMVALFFLSVALGSAGSGLLAGAYDVHNEVPYFGVLGLVAVAVGLVLLLLKKPVSRLMRGVK